MSENRTRKLAQLISMKAQILFQIKELVVKQKTVVDSSELSSLMSLFAAKQQLLDKLHALEKQIDPFRDEDPDLRQWDSTEERTKCQGFANYCNSVLNEITKLEQECEQTMVHQKDLMEQQLKLVDTGVRATSAYLNASVGHSSHEATGRLDLTSSG